MEKYMGTGTVKTYSAQKGFGFIECEQVHGDVSFDSCDLPAVLQGRELQLQGCVVHFELLPHPIGKPVGKNVTISMFQLTIKLMSSETLCILDVEPIWNISDIQALVQRHLSPGMDAKSFLYSAQELKESDTLLSLGIQSDTYLQVVVVGVPHLHLFEPCSAEELSERRGCGQQWLVGGDGDAHIVARGVEHSGMDTASAIAKKVAEEMREAVPFLEMTRINGGEGDENGEIVVISNAGDDPKSASSACLKALAFLRRCPVMGFEGPDLWEAATLATRNWGDYLASGFNADDDVEAQYDPGVLRITKIMAEQLTGHFEFGFNDEVVCAPVIYGGYTSDGSIVGVISSRVWT